MPESRLARWRRAARWPVVQGVAEPVVVQVPDHHRLFFQGSENYRHFDDKAGLLHALAAQT
jgi:hypothetical protein